MHEYMTDATERKVVPGVLGVLSVAAALGLEWADRTTALHIPWFLESPSVFGFYGILHWLFDNHAWRWGVSSLRLSRLPVLQGKWRGEVTSSHNGHRNGTPAELRIRQTWTKIAVTLSTANSRSRSLMAALCVDESDGPCLTYEFLNEPQTHAVESMHTHRGTAHLRVLSGDSRLEGDYYTGRDRMTTGSMGFGRADTARPLSSTPVTEQVGTTVSREKESSP